MDNKLVSIVMPMHNCERFVGESIESVLAQTYPDWELLIVDDCSKDASVSIVREYMEKDPRVRLFENETNKGAAESRNYALREAKGKWIAFLDSDDLWYPEKLEKQIRFMEEKGVHFSYTQYVEMDEEGNPLPTLMTGPKKIGRCKMKCYNFLGCLTVMYDAEQVGLVQIPDLKKRNDYAMWLKAVKKAPCYLLPEVLATYRVRTSGSITNRGQSKWALVKHHYRLFRVSEKKNPISAAFYTGGNMVFHVYKKFRYRKKRPLPQAEREN